MGMPLITYAYPVIATGDRLEGLIELGVIGTGFSVGANLLAKDFESKPDQMPREQVRSYRFGAIRSTANRTQKKPQNALQKRPAAKTWSI
jgi:hypothetical protein